MKVFKYMGTKIPLGGGYPFIRQKYFSINFSIRGTEMHENTVILQFTAVLFVRFDILQSSAFIWIPFLFLS